MLGVEGIARRATEGWNENKDKEGDPEVWIDGYIKNLLKFYYWEVTLLKAMLFSSNIKHTKFAPCLSTSAVLYYKKAFLACIIIHESPRKTMSHAIVHGKIPFPLGYI